MRKLLLGFMTLLMLTPVLACAMTFCPMQEAQAAQTSLPPCHETNDTDADKKLELPMLVLDCMGVDLFEPGEVAYSVPDQQIDTIDFAWVNLTTEYNFNKKHSNAIRGSPYWLQTSQTQPTTILTTQRFRI